MHGKGNKAITAMFFIVCFGAFPLALGAQEKFDGPAFAAKMPIDTKEAWIAWMKVNRPKESPAMLEKRWDLSRILTGYDELAKGPELQREEDLRAFLLAPREFFVRAQNKGKEYIDSPLPIGYGATITDPDVMAMMTSALELKPGEKVLEIGNGSGYQCAILSSLTNEVYTIEIIKPLQAETDQLYTSLEKDYPAYSNIKRKLGDGYYGWEEYAPFDKIIVTCSIDHIPPALQKQLKVGGIMILPLGNPAAKQVLMQVRKVEGPDGKIKMERHALYGGAWVRFIPLTGNHGG